MERSFWSGLKNVVVGDVVGFATGGGVIQTVLYLGGTVTGGATWAIVGICTIGGSILNATSVFAQPLGGGLGGILTPVGNLLSPLLSQIIGIPSILGVHTAILNRTLTNIGLL